MDTGRAYATRVRPESSLPVRMCLSEFQAMVPYTTTRSFTVCVPSPNPTPRLSSPPSRYTWLVSITAPTEHDLCGMCENLDLRSRWRACRGLRSNSANNNTRDRVALSSDDELIMEAEAGRCRGVHHQNQTPRDNCISRHHRRKILRLGAGWRVLGRRGTTLPPMPFPDSLNNGKTAAQTENTRDSARGDTPHEHMTSTASQPRKTEEEEEERGPTAYARVIRLWGSWQRCATLGGCGYCACRSEEHTSELQSP